MEGEEEERDLSSISFRDPVWLQMYPLNSTTVLDYFALSPFYDPACTNEQCRTQWGLDYSHLWRLTGVEYTTIEPAPKYTKAEGGRTFAVPQASTLFVIRKQERLRPNEAAPLRLYYCLYGNIYEAPHLRPLLHGRLRNCLYHLREAFAVHVEERERAAAVLAAEEATQEGAADRDGDLAMGESAARGEGGGKHPAPSAAVVPRQPITGRSRPGLPPGADVSRIVDDLLVELSM
mmetsp:Transcript_12090/g.34058  ORF Transcript_12090/g.34058 Transcript_12090/m.34058 type:complete len:234 (+) Transcript_12090:28-729(+)